MLYYDDTERRGRLAGILATVGYVVSMAVVLLLLRLSVTRSEAGEGILVAFGDVEQAGGTGAAPVDAEPANPEQTAPEPEEIETQEHEDAPEVAPPTESVPDRTVTPERRPDPDALFPGSSQTGNDSRGADRGAGQQGVQEGVMDGDPAGTGLGAQGAGVNIAGRSLVGALPKPNYPSNRSGRVVVDITVDADGRVTTASRQPQGTTTTDSALIEAALEAARKARFTEGEGLQKGTITYNFILK